MHPAKEKCQKLLRTWWSRSGQNICTSSSSALSAKDHLILLLTFTISALPWDMSLTYYTAHLALRSWSSSLELDGGTQCARINCKKTAAFLCPFLQNSTSAGTAQFVQCELLNSEVNQHVSVFCCSRLGKSTFNSLQNSHFCEHAIDKVWTPHYLTVVLSYGQQNFAEAVICCLNK
jgi:hypothetical protein